MDFETVIPEQPCCQNTSPCRIEMDCEITWDCGEAVDVRLPICGGFQVGDSFISVADFIGESETKHIKMVLINFLGEEVDIQLAYSDSLEYIEEGNVICYYEVDKSLSEQLRPGSYQLYVYLVNTLPAINENVGERTILNTLLTCQDGLEVTIS